ncbi:MAG: hypothetical protein QXY21_01855 [Candidatus Micrarchaeaceae archaeon]
MFLAKNLYNLIEKSKAYYKEIEKMLTEYRINVWLTQIKKEKPELQAYSIRTQNRKEKDETLKDKSQEAKLAETMQCPCKGSCRRSRNYIGIMAINQAAMKP